MDKAIKALEKAAESNHRNLKAAFRAADVEHKFTDDVHGTDKGSFLFSGETKSKSEDMSWEEELAALLSQNAENIAALADALGASGHQVESPTSADDSEKAKLLNLDSESRKARGSTVKSSGGDDRTRAEFFGFSED